MLHHKTSELRPSRPFVVTVRYRISSTQHRDTQGPLRPSIKASKPARRPSTSTLTSVRPHRTRTRSHNEVHRVHRPPGHPCCRHPARARVLRRVLRDRRQGERLGRLEGARAPRRGHPGHHRHRRGQLLAHHRCWCRQRQRLLRDCCLLREL